MFRTQILVKFRIRFLIILNITTEEFNKLTAENFAARLKQADLVNKTDFDNKLTSFNRQIIQNI